MTLTFLLLYCVNENRETIFYMLSFLFVMFILPVLIIAVSVYLAHKTGR